MITFLALPLRVSYILRYIVPIISTNTKKNTGWSQSLWAPDDYNTYCRCIENFWSPCINGIVRMVICLVWLLLKKQLTSFNHKLIFSFQPFIADIDILTSWCTQFTLYRTPTCTDPSGKSSQRHYYWVEVLLGIAL